MFSREIGVNLHAIIPFVCGIMMLGLGVFVLSREIKSKVNIAYFFLCFVTSMWMLFYATAYFVNEGDLLLDLFKVGYSGIILIPIGWVQFILYFLGFKRKRGILLPSYGVGCLFLFLLWGTDCFVRGLNRYFWGYYPSASVPVHPFFLLFYAALWSLGMVILWREHNRERSSLKRNHIKYVLFSLFVTILGLGDFMPNYGFTFYPLAPIWAAISIGFFSYGIFRQRLLGINVAITRTGIFFVIYSIVLGIPFLVFFVTRLGALSISLAIVFTSAGPSIYRIFKKQADSILLSDQRRYQNLLLQAATGMVNIHDLNKLAKLVVYTIKRTVGISFACVFIDDKQNGVYRLKAHRDNGLNPCDMKVHFDKDSAFASHIAKHKNPLLYEEFPSRVKKELDSCFYQREKAGISLIVPAFAQESLLGFLVLGEKDNRQPYTKEDLAVFKILANQAALAINYCLFLDVFSKNQEKLFAAEKMGLIGGMAEGLAHQIRNRLNLFSVAAGELRFGTEEFTAENRELLGQNPALEKELKYYTQISQSLMDNVKHTSGIIKGIITFGEMQDAEKAPACFSLSEVIPLILDMLKLKYSQTKFPLVNEVNEDGLVYGFKTQIVEILYALLNNAYDATRLKQTRLKETPEAEYAPCIKIALKSAGEASLITLSDNGEGVRDEDKKKVFAPFFTTKSSAESGSGLGMYTVKRLIEQGHKGKIWFESRYTQGTTFYIRLPNQGG